MNTNNRPIDSTSYEKDLWELEWHHRRARRFESAFRLYALFGGIFGLIGLAFFIVGRLKIEVRFEDRIYLLIAGVGFGLSILSWAFLYWRRVSDAQDLERGRYMSGASEFLLQWIKFENAAKARLSTTTTEFNKYSIREVVSKLVAGGMLSPADAASLEEAIRFRDLLVHSGRLVPVEHLARMTKATKQIANRLTKSPTDSDAITT